MNLQTLTVIFVIIALPVIIILSVYVQYQVDTATLKGLYTSKLVDATHEAIVAFELNTTNNKYSTVADSLIRDIEASINTFSISFSANLGISGASKSNIMSYVPALLYTLYDGYYIYAPVQDEQNNTFEHTLKPYVYYTREYTSGNKRIVINFSLDNYVAVYYYDGKSYTSKAGYLELFTDNKNEEGIYIEGEKLYYNKEENTVEIGKEEKLKRTEYVDTVENNKESTSTSAYDYYKEAYEFTNWYNDIIGEMFDETSIQYQTLYIDENNSALPRTVSNFNDEKTDVIKNSITNNLIQAMDIYRRNAVGNFKMPELTGDDWNTILNNICVISFMQGLPVGTTIYNNYVILTSTENEQYADEDSIYYIGSDSAYHRIWCPHLEGNKIVRI